jgi:hypothetical protein
VLFLREQGYSSRYCHYKGGGKDKGKGKGGYKGKGNGYDNFGKGWWNRLVWPVDEDAYPEVG